jgi:hypothetical protein
VRKRLIAGILAGIVVVGLVVANRHELLRFAIEQIVRVATGYALSIGDVHFGSNRAQLLDVQVTHNGDPVLSARRVEVSYSLRDLLPGSSHRFGLLGIAVDGPTFTLDRRSDGSYNVIAPSVAVPSGQPAPPNPIPLRFTARLRDGSVIVVDDSDRAAGPLRLVEINGDLTYDSAAVSRYLIAGKFESTRQPIEVQGTMDVTRGFAMHRLRAPDVPIRTLANTLINSPAARLLAGSARNVDARLYALDLLPGGSFDYHIGAQLDVESAQMQVSVLEPTIDHIVAHVQIVDDAAFTKHVNAQVHGVPVKGAGGVFDFSEPFFRLGIATAADFAQLRQLFEFSKAQPVRGPAQASALLEGPLAQPLIVAYVTSPRAFYRAVPIDDLSARVAVVNSDVIVSPLLASYSGIAAQVRGGLIAGEPLQTDVAAHISASAKHLPYLNELIPNEPIVGDGILRGRGSAFGAHGQITSKRDVSRAAAMFSFDSNGVADIAPVYVRGDRGGIASGRYVLDRRSGASAFWFVGENLALHAPSAQTFPGATLPKVPPIDGALGYAAVVGGGSSGNDIVIAGRVDGGRATITNVRFDTLEATFAGNLQNASINTLRAAGPWGRFDGNGSFSGTQLVARGSYAGTLQGLRPYIGIAAAGAVSGPVALAIGTHGLVVQARDVTLGPGASIHGVPVGNVSGTLGYDNGRLRVYSASANIAGGRLVAAGDYGTSAQTKAADALELIGAGLRGHDLAGIGVPIDAGVVAVDGTVEAQAGPIPAFDGGVVLREGSSLGYPVSGSALLGLHGSRLHLDHGIAGLGSGYGFVTGNIGALDSRALIYALHADVPAADIVETLHTLRLPTYLAQGVFGATIAISGSGSAPTVSGLMRVPGGEVNGLPFIDARADVSAGTGSMAARHGSVQVGSTQLDFHAHLAPSYNSVGVRSRRATLSDFNDFFDTGDTLAGTGPIDVALASGNHRASTRGDVNLWRLRYRSFPFGNTTARWSSREDNVTGNVAIRGGDGTLLASGSIGLAPSKDVRRLIARSRYDINANASDVNLDRWLPAAGFPTIPLLGHVHASARVRGAYPGLSITADAALTGGSFAEMPIDKLTASIRGANGTVYLERADFEAPGIAATGEGKVGYRRDAPLELTVHATSNDLHTLIAHINETSVNVTGHFESTAQIGGTLAQPTFNAGFEGTNVNAYGIKIDSLFGAVRLLPDGIELRNSGATFKQGQMTLAGTLPLQLQPFSLGPGSEPVSFDFELIGMDPGILDPLLGHNAALGGSVDGHVGLSGTVQAPLIHGRLLLRDGSYTSDLKDTKIKNAVATLTFGGTSATLEEFAAKVGSGSVHAQGTMSFPHGFGAYGDVQYALHAKADSAQLILPDYGSGTLNATADLTRNGRELGLLKGRATLSDAVIPISAFLRAGSAGGGTVTSPPPPDSLNLAFAYDVVAGRNVRVRGGGFGAGLDIGVGGEATLAGTLHAPTMDGQFTSSSGTITFVDRVFRLQSGAVTFSPANGIVPTLQATAGTRVTSPGRNVDVTISLSGPLTNLSVDFASNPPGYTKEQMLGMIAPFGGLVNGVAFTTNAPGGPGALFPGTAAIIPNPGALPTVAIAQANGTVSVGQEAFNIINAQFASALLSPIETGLGQGLGLGNVSLSLDFYGNVGVNVRRQIGPYLYAIYYYTFGYAQRQTFGLEYAPSDATVAQLAFFYDNGPTRLYYDVYPYETVNGVTSGQSLFGQSGFTLTYQHRFW